MQEKESPRDESSPKKDNGIPPAFFAAYYAIMLGVFLVVVFAASRLGVDRVTQISSTAKAAGTRIWQLSIAIGAGALALVFLIARLRRPNRVTVFVSYPHEQIAIALALVDCLTSRRIRVRMIPFTERPNEHDDVITEAARNVREAHLVVGVVAQAGKSSSPDDPRFYHAEIFAATVSKKPVVLLGWKREFHLPSTAYTGYPVLEIAELQRRRYQPLVALTHYAVGTKKTVDESVLGSIVLAVALLAAVGYSIGRFWLLILPIVAVSFMAVFVLFNGLEGAVQGVAAYRHGSAAIFYSCCAITIFIVWIWQFRVQLRVRQSFREQLAGQRMSNEAVASLLGTLDHGPEIVACLLQTEEVPNAPP